MISDINSYIIIICTRNIESFFLFVLPLFIIHFVFFFINIDSSQYRMKVISLSIKFWSTSTSTSRILCIGFLVVFVLLTKKALFTQILLLKSGWKLERIYHVISIALNLSFFPHTIITSRLCNTNSKAGYTRLIS